MNRKEMHEMLMTKHNIYEKAAHKAADIVWDFLGGDTIAEDERQLKKGMIEFI